MSTSRQRRPVAIDLFCGAGGMSVGFEQAGFDILLAIDRDPYHVATHHRNFPYGRFLGASVTDLSGKDLLAQLGNPEEVDLIYGGPPCQGFSTMGLRDAQDPRNSLVDHFARLVEEVRPRAFVMENVPGMNTGATAPLFKHLMNRMQQAGYSITLPVQVLNAADFGVPQNRRRLFVLGVRSDLGSSIQYPTGPVEGQPPRPTVLEAIADLPPVDDLDELFNHDTTPYTTQPSPQAPYALVARGLLEDKGDLARLRVWSTTTCSGCSRVRHSPKAVALYQATAPGATVPGHRLPRLDPNGIAPTLRAGTDSERGSHTAPRPVHPLLPRVITAREAARLHGYPDWFDFYPAKWHAYRQIGNSVCPPVARAIGRQVLTALGIDPASLPRPPVHLTNTFTLAEDRPKHERRVPIATEYPKVINELWQRACGKDGEKPSRLSFTAEDIRLAITASGAMLPRTRPDRFLTEVSRYRGVRKLIELPAKHGFTMQLTDPESGSGSFVPLGTIGAVGEKPRVEVHSGELNSAQSIEVLDEVSDERSLAQLLGRADIVTALSHGRWSGVALETDLFGLAPTGPYKAVATNNKGGKEGVYVVVGVNGQLPPKSALLKVAERDNQHIVLLLATLTRAHILGAVFDVDATACVERSRSIFVISKRHSLGRTWREREACG